MVQSIDVYSFCLGIVRERDHLEDRLLEVWLILNWIFRKWNGFMYLIEFFQGSSRKRKLLNVVMNSKGCLMFPDI